jgi:3-deoxy-D-manno-octulosonic-acid transferase
VFDPVGRVSLRAFALTETVIRMTSIGEPVQLPLDDAGFPERTGPGADAHPPPIGWRLAFYRAATALARPVFPLLLAERRRRGKEDGGRLAERYGWASVARPGGPLVWVHAASVGETNAVLPLIDRFVATRADHTLLLTTGTLTSAELAARRLPAAVPHQFVPVDAAVHVRRFLQHWQPSLAVLTESELWPNLVVETHLAGVPIALVNARLSERSYTRWQRARSSAAALMGRLDLVAAQSPTMAARFRALGARRVITTGNLKADAPPLPVDAATVAALVGALADRPRLLAASTHPGEEEIVLEAAARLTARLPRLCTLIAPRHRERGPALAELARKRGFVAKLRSSGAEPDGDCSVYIADTIGELGSLYSVSPVSLIGGSLVRKGGQNPLEAVRRGSLVIAGPHVVNFEDIYAALNTCGAAQTVSDAEALAAGVWQLLADPAERERRRRLGGEALGRMTGALARTLAELENLSAEARERARA